MALEEQSGADWVAVGEKRDRIPRDVRLFQEGLTFCFANASNHWQRQARRANASWKKWLRFILACSRNLCSLLDDASMPFLLFLL